MTRFLSHAIPWAALLLSGLSCSTSTSGPAPQRVPTRIPSPPPVRKPADFTATVPTFEQLKTGNFSGILHGAGPLWSRREYHNYRASFPDTIPILLRHGLNLRESSRRTFTDLLDFVRSDIAAYPGVIPLLSIQFNIKQPASATIGLDAEVGRGEFDAELVMIADMVRDTDGPFFLRIGSEVNGPWNGYSPEHFPAAFRHVVDVFREAGADKAIFLWNYKAVPTSDNKYMAWYPGDKYVDWWSVDLFGEDFMNPKARQHVAAFLADALVHGKPVLIPECAPSEFDINARMTWDRWFTPFFALLNSHSNVKGFCYSNRNFEKRDVQLEHWGDMRISQSALKPQYIHLTESGIHRAARRAAAAGK
jgi:hypothetical protein